MWIYRGIFPKNEIIFHHLQKKLVTNDLFLGLNTLFTLKVNGAGLWITENQCRHGVSYEYQWLAL